MKQRYVVLDLLILALFACATALIPAQAQTESQHHFTQTTKPSKQRVKKKKQVQYSCPMHPDVVAKKAGRCPKCGMDLRMERKDETTAESKVNQDVTPNVPFVQTTAQTSRMHIPDVALLDQNGSKLHFYSDLVKGQTVAINFIFTTCTTICPPLGATFARVQKELGDKAGRDVRFISISVDPAIDTPERLKAWGEKFHAGDSWTFVTGDKPQVDELLRALGASSASREDHSPTILIGNDVSGVWTRTYGLAKTSQVVQLIDDAIAGKPAVTAAETTRQ